jgi:hypothetical protein
MFRKPERPNATIKNGAFDLIFTNSFMILEIFKKKWTQNRFETIVAE